MDLYACFIMSLVQMLVLNRWTELAFTTDYISRFLLYFSTQYAMLKAYRTFIYPHFISPMRHMPGPKDNFPLLGQMKNLFAAPTPFDMYVKWANQWPDAPFVRHLGLGNQEILMVNTPTAHKEVLQTYCYSFVKPEMLFRFIGEVIGRGLLFSEKSEHKKQRRMVMGLFSMPNLKRILPLFQEKAQILTDLFSEKVDENGVGCVNVSDFYTKATMDITGVTILGVELDNLRLPNQDMNFIQCYTRVLEQGPLSTLISFINVYLPIRRWVPLEANRGYVRANNEIRRMLRTCIRKRIEDIGRGDKGVERTFGRDLLTLMIEEREKFAYEGAEVLTETEIMEHLLNFLAGGHETTAGAMTWASFLLATHPDVQEKLQAEITGFVQNYASWDYQAIESLHYLNNFCKEVLRVYCPAILSYREATVDITICGQFIPKGTTLVLMPAITNRAKALWGQDAEEFVVDRWDHLAPEAADPYATGTFFHGPRVCIGKNFGLMEFKILLIEVLSKFRFGMTPQLEALEGKTPEVRNPAPSLRPKGELQVRIEKL
ncbi:cytochrome P450 3A5 [Thozetella sp. PMI_491]|nr:cytochrome P450 3A5 [Thozetella sp. PMI_491]